jgi:hypothetical protein
MMTDKLESRKDRTRDLHFPYSPRLGMSSGVCLTAILLLQLALFSKANDMSNYPTLLWLAAVWSGWSIGIWVLVRQPLSLRRALSLGLLLAWHCILLSARQTQLPDQIPVQPPERYLILLGFYGLMQSVASILLQLPAWRFWGEPDTASRKRYQFGILSIAMFTTGLAIILFAVRRYGDRGGDAFLSSTALVMASLLMVAMVAMLTSVSNRWHLLGLASVMVVASSAASMMEAAENLTQGYIPTPVRWDNWYVYMVVVNTFGLIMYLFGTCGRLDGRQIEARPTESSAPPRA